MPIVKEKTAKISLNIPQTDFIDYIINVLYTDIPKDRVTNIRRIQKTTKEKSDQSDIRFFNKLSKDGKTNQKIIFSSIYQTDITLKYLDDVYYHPRHQFVLNGKLYCSDRGAMKAVNEHYVYRSYESIIAMSHHFHYFYLFSLFFNIFQRKYIQTVL